MDTQTIIRRIMDEVDDNHLYTASTLAMLARDQGYEQLMQRVRVALKRLAKINSFPAKGDGELEGYSIPIPAWFGWRWREALGLKLQGGNHATVE